MTLLILNIILGLFFIGIGFLVKSYPNLISGYSTMSKEKKKNVDIEGLSAFMKKGFIIIGILLIFNGIIFKALGLEILSPIVMISIIIIGAIIILIKGQKYNHNKRKNKIVTYIIICILLLFITGFMIYGLMSAKIIFKDEKIEFTGSYGFELNLSEIESFELTDEIPLIQIRTNGLSIGHINKGTFKLDSWGKCQLMLNSNKPPFLIVVKKDGERIIINNKDKSKTEETYNYIKSFKETEELQSFQ